MLDTISKKLRESDNIAEYAPLKPHNVKENRIKVLVQRTIQFNVDDYRKCEQAKYTLFCLKKFVCR